MKAAKSKPSSYRSSTLSSDLRELLRHHVFLSLGGADGHQRGGRLCVQAELIQGSCVLELVGHRKAQLLAFIQEAFGHFYHPGTSSAAFEKQRSRRKQRKPEPPPPPPPVPPVVGAFGVQLVVQVKIGHQQVFGRQLLLGVLRQDRTDSETERHTSWTDDEAENSGLKPE